MLFSYLVTLPLLLGGLLLPCASSASFLKPQEHGREEVTGVERELKEEGAEEGQPPNQDLGSFPHYDDASFTNYDTPLDDLTSGTSRELISSLTEEDYEEEDDTTTMATTKIPGGPPQDLSAVPLSSTQLNVSWSPPDSKPLYYGVRVSSPYLDEITYDTFYVISGLDPCSSYMLEVSSVYGDESYPDTTSGKTDSDVPPPPPSCRIREVTSNSMRVTWAVPSTSCQIVNYSLSWTYDVLWSEEQGSDQIITPGTEVSTKNLIPWTNYTYSIAAATDAGYGKPLHCSEKTLEYIPGLVNITDVTVSDASATIYWLPPDPANGVTTWYHVNLVDDDGNGHPKQFSGSVLKGTMDADDGLEPCVSYTVSIQAENNAGSGPLNSYDEPFIIYFDVPVESVDCSMDKWTMEVCWVPNSVSCPVSKYILNWTSVVLWSGESDIGIIEVPGDTTDLCQQRDSLTPYATYTVCVNVGEDTSGECCSKRTDPAAPSAPYLKELAVDGVSLTASWDEPEQKNGILNGYSITWTDSQGTVKGQSFDNSTLSFTIKDLERCETYTVVVQAETVGGGFGPNSNERIATITNSVSDTGMQCDGSQSREATVRWTLEANDCPVTHYNVSWSTTVLWNGEQGGSFEVIAGDRIDYTVTGLQPYTTFEFCITIENSLEKAVCCSGTTAEEPPSEPEDLQMINVDQNSISVEWTMPATLNGDLKNWLVNCSTVNSVVVNATVGKDQTNYTCNHLNPGTKYTVMVKASTGAGLGDPATLEQSTISGKNENMGLIVGLSVGGGLLLLLLLVVGGAYYYRRRRQPVKRKSAAATRTPVYKSKGEDNRAMEMNEYDSYSRDMYEEQQKSYRQQRYWSEKIHGKIDFGTTSEIHAKARLSLRSLDAPTGNPDVSRDRRRSSQMESEFTSFGLLPRLSSASTDEAARRSDDRRASGISDYKPKMHEDISRRYSVQPFGASRIDEIHRRPSQQSDKEIMRRENRDRRSSAQPRMSRIEEEERRRSQEHGGRRVDEFARRPSLQPDERRRSDFHRRPSLQPGGGRAAVDDVQRRRSMMPSYERSRRSDAYDAARRSEAPRRHSIQPEIKMRRPEEFPGLYDARRQSLDTRISGRRPSEEHRGPRSSMPGPSSRRSSASLVDEVDGRRRPSQQLRGRDYGRPSRMWTPSGLPDIQDEYE